MARYGYTEDRECYEYVCLGLRRRRESMGQKERKSYFKSKKPLRMCNIERVDIDQDASFVSSSISHSHLHSIKSNVYCGNTLLIPLLSRLHKLTRVLTPKSGI